MYTHVHKSQSVFEKATLSIISLHVILYIQHTSVFESPPQPSLTGNIEEAIGHFINFVHFSGNPRATLSTLQQTMPAPLFSLLVRAYATLQSEVSPPSL